MNLLAMENLKAEDEGLVFEGAIPIRVETIDAFPQDSTLVTVNEKNEHVLKSSLMPAEPADIDEHDDLAVYLKRQEVKLDLLFDMVAELLYREGKMPPEVNIKLTSHGVEFPSTLGEFNTGQKLQLQVNLTLPEPRPLMLYALVISPASEDGLIAARFVGVSQTMSYLLDKILFRHHRRMVALSKSSS